MFQMAQQHEANEKSLRSVFVGNIPYEATEDNLKEIFSQVGTVLSFRLVYDRETNKPKGYGFCEYQDQETAKSAMRTLSGYELSGRSLRVDTATSDKTDELKTMGPTGKVVPEVTPYGAPCPPDNAPQAISQAIASLPPEQMFDLMKQMKNSILGKPNEARRLLEENPQLSFALLQTLIVMRVLDPTVAQNMLHTVRPSNNRAESRQFRPRPPPPERYIPDHGAPSPIGRQQPPIGRAPSLPPVECPQPPVGRPQPPVGRPQPPVGRPQPPLEYPQPPLEYPQPPVGRQQPPIGCAPSQPPIGRAPSQPPIGRAPSQPPVGRPQPPVRRQQPPVGRAPSLPRTPDIGGQTDQEDLIRQVMMLSDDQIASLPEEQRNTLLLFKQQYKHSVM